MAAFSLPSMMGTLSLFLYYTSYRSLHPVCVLFHSWDISSLPTLLHLLLKPLNNNIYILRRYPLFYHPCYSFCMSLFKFSKVIWCNYSNVLDFHAIPSCYFLCKLLFVLFPVYQLCRQVICPSVQLPYGVLKQLPGEAYSNLGIFKFFKYECKNPLYGCFSFFVCNSCFPFHTVTSSCSMLFIGYLLVQAHIIKLRNKFTIVYTWGKKNFFNCTI